MNAADPPFTGVGVALVTLFDATGELDAEATARHAGHLVDRGVRAVLVAGSTGEAAALDADERSRLLVAVRDAVGRAGPGDRRHRRAVRPAGGGVVPAGRRRRRRRPARPVAPGDGRPPALLRRHRHSGRCAAAGLPLSRPIGARHPGRPRVRAAGGRHQGLDGRPRPPGHRDRPDPLRRLHGQRRPGAAGRGDGRHGGHPGAGQRRPRGLHPGVGGRRHLPARARQRAPSGCPERACAG